MELCDHRDHAVYATQLTWRSGCTGMDHTDPSADYRIPGRLPYGKRTYPGNDRSADAGWSRVHIYGHHQTCG